MKIVDSNEPEIIREKLKALGWEQSRLNSADYGFTTINNQSVGIERKTISDLLQSLQDRLSLQFYKQLEDYNINILLIEGHWGKHEQFITIDYQAYNVTWEQVWNYLRTWQDWGIGIELTIDTDHTVQRIEQIYNYYQKPEHIGGLGHKTFADTRILSLCIPQIGIKTAQRLLEHFSTVQNIATASMLELMKCPKLGAKQASSIYLHFRKSDKITLTGEING